MGENAMSHLHSRRTPSKGGTKSKLAASPSLLGGPHMGENATSPLHFEGSANKGGLKQNSLPHPCLLGGPKEGGNATSTLHSRGSPNKGGTKSELVASSLPSRGPKKGRNCYVNTTFLGIPKPKQGQNQNWLPHPCLLGGPQMGENAMSPLHSRGCPIKGDKVRIYCLTRAFSGCQKRAEMLRQCYVTLAFSRIPNKGGPNQSWLPHPCLLGCPKEGGNAT